MYVCSFRSKVDVMSSVIKWFSNFFEFRAAACLCKPTKELHWVEDGMKPEADRGVLKVVSVGYEGLMVTDWPDDALSYAYTGLTCSCCHHL